MDIDFLSFTACGLLFDIAGVVLLGAAFFLKTKKSIAQEGGTYWDSNPHLVRNIVASKFDGIVGTLFLFVGFVFQFVGATGFQWPQFLVWAYGIGAFAWLLYLFYIRKVAVASWASAIKVASKSG